MAIASSTPRFYDPRAVRMILGGAIVTDFMEGTMISFSKDEDLITPTTGVLGETALAVNRNNRGTVTISLKQTSPSHELLERFQTAVRAGGNPSFPFNFVDNASGITVNTFAWIQTQPDFALGSEVASLEWVIGLHDMVFENAAGANLLADAIQAITATA